MQSGGKEMKYILILTVISFMFYGCQRGMTNDEVIAETHKCEQAGLRAMSYITAIDDRIIIRCMPRVEVKK